VVFSTFALHARLVLLVKRDIRQYAGICCPRQHIPLVPFPRF